MTSTSICGFWTGLRNCLRAMGPVALIAMLALPGVAFAQKGVMGGLIGLGGCMEGCLQNDFRPTNGDCHRYCECSLTIEASRWKEELANTPKRQAACAKRIFPQIVGDPKDEGKPKTAPGVAKWVLICTPQYPETAVLDRALAEATFKAHWELVDRRLNQLKDSKQSQLHQRLPDGNNTWVIKINSSRNTEKIASIESMGPHAQCPERYLKRRYRFLEWMNARGLDPDGVESF